MASDIPGAVLFCCTHNSIRSPMAEAMLRHYWGHRIYVDSCGLRAGERDEFVVAVLDEIGIDAGRLKPKCFDDLEDTSFDLVVSLSPQAHHRALEMTRTMAIDVEYWPTIDPSDVAGSRDQILEAYRATRDSLLNRIRRRFGSASAPVV